MHAFGDTEVKSGTGPWKVQNAAMYVGSHLSGFDL